MADYRKQHSAWIDRQQNLINLEEEVVNNALESAENGYDSIDLIIDLILSTVTSDVEEYLENEYIESYQSGVDDIAVLEPSEMDIYVSIHAEVDGKSFTERLEEYADDLYSDLMADAEDALSRFLNRLAALTLTDGHRVRNEAVQQAGEDLSSVGFAVTKTWRSVKIPTTRDTHFELDGTTVPLDGYFETVNGKAKHPGGFGVAEEDCNCLCYLTLNVM